MTKAGEKLLKAAEEALDYARGKPAEGTRESWFSRQDMRWHARTFRNGKWEENSPPFGYKEESV